MKAVALLQIDLATSPLGTRSRLADELAGTPVLRRTIARLQRCPSLAGIVLAHRPDQAEAVRVLTADLPVERREWTSTAPYAPLVRVARKWAIDGWRGGIGGSTAFDEYLDVQSAVEVVEHDQADCIVSVPPGATLIDPLLVEAIVDHAARHAEESKITFAQAPPGLVPFVAQASVCRQLAAHHLPPGWTLAYKPTEPRPDLTFSRCCLTVDQAIRYAAGRLTADTTRSWAAMTGILRDGAGESAATAAQWLLTHENDLEALPREVEIELTTEDPLPRTLLRARGGTVPARGPLDIELVAKLGHELATPDDSLVLLGGHGDPLLHPRFPEIVKLLRRSGVYGLAVATTAQRVSDEAIAALLEAKVDAVIVQLDAWTQEVYQQVQGGGSLAEATAAIDRLLAAREAAGALAPLVVPHLTKSTLNVAELDPFFDGWIRRVGAAVVAGYTHYAGRLPDRACLDMTPPARTACRRLARRAVVLADGTVAACDQDVTGRLALGHLGAATLADIWAGPPAVRLRGAHASAEWDRLDPCRACSEWHRP